MPDYLAAKDWKAVLDMKEHKSVKKTGVSDTLDEYASAKKKDDLGRMVSALERIVEKAGEVKSAQSKFPKIVSHMTEMIKAAKGEQQKLAPRLGNIANKGDDEDNEDSTLGKQLAKIRQVDAESAWNFVLVPGKPSSGFVVSKKTLKKSDNEKAFEMRGKRGPFFTGTIFFEGGKFVLDLGPEVSPPAGIAKGAKNAAQLHAEMNIKVVVRGAGKEIDGETDIEPAEEGGGQTEAPMQPGNHTAAYTARIDQVEQAIGRFLQSPTAKVEGAADALFSALGMIRRQITGDDKMNDHTKAPLFERLDGLQQRLNTGTTAPKANPAAKYPTETQWKALADQVIRLEPGKAQEGWQRFKAQHGKYVEMFRGDTELKDPERTQVQQTLMKALELMRGAIDKTKGMVETAKTDNALAKRFVAMERKFTQMENTPGLNPGQVGQVRTALTTLQDLFKAGKLDVGDQRLARLDQAIEGLAKQAFKISAETSRIKGQQDIHQTLSVAMPLLKKASLPVGLIKNPQAIRDAEKSDPKITEMLRAMSDAMKSPGEDNGRKMEEAARKLVLAFEDPRAEERSKWAKEQAEKGTSDPFPNPDRSEVELLAIEAMRRGQMMRLTAQYESIGAPPWDQGKQDLASQIQAEIFFLESAIANDFPKYQAPATSASDGGGASGSWWIERTNANTGDGKRPGAKKKLIFKPGEKEGTAFSGMPPGSGAPREVLAKKLDDFMANSGFNVGISPTTLANVDGRQLYTERDQTPMKPGPTLGSMQQLSPNDGPLGKAIVNGKFDPAFAASIDKRSFDDVAVFDMIFANLDRHPNNLLVEKDPDTGKNKIVPIDHGSAMPDPDFLQMNRRSVSGSGNIFAKKELPNNDEPLGPQALEALARLDPDQMVAEMKRARDDISGRHKETEGMVDDKAIEALAARARFVKFAAPQMSIREVFELMSAGAGRIAKAKPEDFPQLIQTLKEEVADIAKAESVVTEIKAALGETNAEGKVDMFKVTDTLTSLGWAVGVSKDDLDDWVVGNAKLVQRVLKGNIVNPAVAGEIQRLLPEAKKSDAKIEAKLAGLPPGKQVKLLRDEVNKAKTAWPRSETLDQLKSEFDRLGGAAEVKKALAVFGYEMNGHKDVPVGDDEQAETAWRDLIERMRKWQLFKDKGGVAAMVRIGAVAPRDMKFDTAFALLDEGNASQDAIRDVVEMDEETLDEISAEAYRDLAVECDVARNTLIDRGEKEKMKTNIDVAARYWQDDKPQAAMTVLSSALGNAKDAIAKEAKFVKETDEAERKIEDRFGKLDDRIAQAVQPFMQGIRDKLARAKQTVTLSLRSQAVKEFDARVDIAEKGDQAAYRGLEKGYDGVKQRVDGHAAYPWHASLMIRATDIRRNLDLFQDDGVAGNIKQLNEIVDAVDFIRGALGNADLNNLPGPVQTIVNEWVTRARDYSKINEGAKSAEEIRMLLAQPVG